MERLVYWHQQPFLDRNRRIWDEELEAFMPASILDFHVHLMNPGVIPDGGTFNSGGPHIAHYRVEDLARDAADVFPRRRWAAVCFGFPHVGYDFAANNHYLAGVQDRKRCWALRLLDPFEADRAAVHRDLASGRFVGLKPYPDYARKPNVNDATIRDMLPEWAMEIANATHSIIMLHLPRSGRLADPLNQQQIVEWCSKYPHTRIVLAHIGRAYFYRNVVGNLDRIRALPNCYVDLTMVNHWEVMEYTFNTLAADRILFGTDIPIALAPGKSVEINHSYTYVTPEPWPLSISDEHHKIVFTSFLYEELRAIRHACERAGKDRAFVEGLFWHNGMKLLGA